jgi:hypothetical protein
MTKLKIFLIVFIITFIGNFTPAQSNLINMNSLNINGRIDLKMPLTNVSFFKINQGLHPYFDFNADSTAVNTTQADKSFFKSGLFYFLGAIAAVVTVYLLWPGKEKPVKTSVTFGLPPAPR